MAKIQIRLPRNFHLDHRFCFPSQIRVATAPQRCSIRRTGNIRSRLRAGMRASAWFRRPSHRTCWDGSAINVSGPSGCSGNSQLAVPGARDLLLLPVSVPPVGITLTSWETGALERIRLVPVDGSSGSDGRLTGALDRPAACGGTAWPGTMPMPVSRAEIRIMFTARRLHSQKAACGTDGELHRRSSEVGCTHFPHLAEAWHSSGEVSPGRIVHSTTSGGVGGSQS